MFDNLSLNATRLPFSQTHAFSRSPNDRLMGYSDSDIEMALLLLVREVLHVT